MMKSQNVSNKNMFIHGPTFPIKIKRKISVKDWEVFENIADETKEFWQIFWRISNDKKLIKEKKICAVFYLEEYVFPHLSPLMKYVVMNGLTDNNGLSVIISLYLNMIPKDKCKKCDCEMSETDWVRKI